MRNNKLAPTLVAMGLAVYGIAASSGNEDREPTVDVYSVSRFAISRILVRVQNASGVAHVVPYCGKDVAGIDHLCPQLTRLERWSSSGWSTAPRPRSGSVPGGLSVTDTSIIGPGQRASFEYTFTGGDYEVHAGDRLRVVIETWHDRDSVSKMAATSELVSEPFDLPKVSRAD